MKELISVIIPNRATETNQTLPSLKKQTYKNIEIIEIIDKQGKGASWARNQGLKKAKGAYLFFCDNDLELESDCLESLHRTLTENKEADWAFGRFMIDGVEFNRNKGAMPADLVSREFVDYFHGISTMSLIRATAKPKWDESLRRYDDWDLWIRLTRNGHLPVFCDRLLFRTVNRPGGITNADPNDIRRWTKVLYKKHVKKVADIIIPHHDQHKMLSGCLEKIDNQLFNIIVVSGGSFSENCNKGARLAETDNLIFLNDDTIPSNECLTTLARDQHDITGIAQFIPSQGVVRYGITIMCSTNGEIIKTLSRSQEEVTIPSGFCFKVNRSAWEKLGGLDEEYENGGEDVDLFLKAKQMKMAFGYVRGQITHFLSQSDGRFLFAYHNEQLFNKRWSHIICNKKNMARKKAQEVEEVQVERLEKVTVTSDCFVCGRNVKKGDSIDVDEITKEKLQKAGCITRNRMMTT